MTTNNGGPAFPVMELRTFQEEPGAGLEGGRGMTADTEMPGIIYAEKRQGFSSQFMAGGLWSDLRLSREAVQYTRSDLNRENSRMCVNCGRIRAAEAGRVDPGTDCQSPDACTWDLTPEEAWQYWRDKYHKMCAIQQEREP